MVAWSIVNQKHTIMTTEFLNEKFALSNCEEINAGDSNEITWDKAREWTKRFREVFGEKQEFSGKKVKGYFMSRGNIEDLLSQDGLSLQGIKVYLGYDENDVFRIIVVAVKGGLSVDYNVPRDIEILEDTTIANLPSIGEPRPCPEHCGDPNVLNTD